MGSILHCCRSEDDDDQRTSLMAVRFWRSARMADDLP